MTSDALTFFINDNTIGERADLLTGVLSLLTDFSYDKNIVGDIDQVILDSSTRTTSFKLDYVDAVLLDALTDVLKEHTITISTEASLSELYELCKGLFSLLELTDFTDINRILDTNEEPAMVISEILESMTGVDKYKTLSLIVNIDPVAIDRLKEFANKAVDDPDGMIDKAIVERLRLYFELHSNNPLTHALLTQQLPVGQELETYITSIEDILYDTTTDLAVSVFGLLLYSGVELDDILTVYRDKSELLIGNLSLMTEVDTLLIKYIGSYQDAIKAKIETGKHEQN